MLSKGTPAIQGKNPRIRNAVCFISPPICQGVEEKQTQCTHLSVKTHRKCADHAGHQMACTQMSLAAL